MPRKSNQRRLRKITRKKAGNSQNNDIKDRQKSLKRPVSEVLSWDDYFMGVAFLTAMRSKDPCTQVGACIVNEKDRIVGLGYNGMPNRCSDDDLPWAKDEKLGSTEKKYFYVCHSEMNAIMNENSTSLDGCRIYVSLFPCNECAKLIIQSGIRKVLYASKKEDKDETKAAEIMLNMADVIVKKYPAGKTEFNFEDIVKKRKRQESESDK